jgi:cytochrome c oxidase subunit 2
LNEHSEVLLRSASTMGPKVDALFLALLGVTGFVALALAFLIVFFSLHYRRGSNADRSDPPSRARWIEISWTIMPLLIFLGIFVWSFVVFAQLYQPPRDAMHVQVLGKQWMWKLEHANGRREINELHVPVGRPVELTMTSQDVIHDFFVPAFRIKQDVLPGRYTNLWFTATKTGRFNIFCAEFCGLCAVAICRYFAA